MSKTGTLTFNVTGENYMNLLYAFFSEGNYRGFQNLINEFGLPNEDEYMAKCWSLKFIVTGDSADDSLMVKFLDESPEDYAEMLWVGFKTAVTSNDLYDYGLFSILRGDDSVVNEMESWEQIEVLLKHISKDDFLRICQTQIINHFGFREYENFKAALDHQKDKDYTISGIIARTGKFYECGYQQHRELLPKTYALGITSGSGSLMNDEDDTVHISSSMIAGGDYGFAIQNDSSCHWTKDIPVPVIKSLWSGCDELNGYYSSNSDGLAIGCNLVHSTIEIFGKGSKYGQLMFLKEIAPELFNDSIKLVNFSLDYNDIQTDQVFIRTSPLKSIAGVLNSKLRYKDDIIDGITEITSEFAKYQDVVKNNELHYFFQDFLEGDNGVANFDNGVFGYDLSENQGDIVNGKTGNEKLSAFHCECLEKLLSTLYSKVQNKIQIEFVRVDDVIYIVQLRVFRNHKIFNNVDNNEKDIERALVVGDSFHYIESSRGGSIEVNMEDILIVEQDADSKDLIGKKALIVKDGSEFSHILALSTALRIPAIYKVTKLDDAFYQQKSVKFLTQRKQGFVFEK